MAGGGHCERFCTVRPGWSPSAALEAALAAALEVGQTAWPALALEEGAFLAHLATCIEPPDPAAIGRAHLADLYLACACAIGATRSSAIDAFAKTYLVDVPSYLSASRNANLADEVSQILLERFFVGGIGEPKILDYTGRGPLRGWIRVAAVRAALSIRRAEKSGDADDLDALVASVDPELDAVKLQYKDDFARALVDALEALGERERALLKLHYIDGVPVERLAKLYGVHRGSASRWLSTARDKVMEDTRTLLRERLKLTDSQFASVAALVQSQLDLSLRKLLRTSR